MKTVSVLFALISALVMGPTASAAAKEEPTKLRVMADDLACIGEAKLIEKAEASPGNIASLQEVGSGVTLTKLPGATTLAFRYASVAVGAISVAVEGGETRKVNVHSTGSMSDSFLYARIGLEIPKGGTVSIARVTGESIEVICPREPGAGTIEVFIDGDSVGKVNLGSETRIAQARVLKVENLENGEHEVTVRHKSGGPVAVDAIYAFPSRVQEVNPSDLIIETREPKNDHS